ncbi:cytochrome P450 [Sphingobium sp. Sx8-8]|uniref:cytochrome P450 n=1 Tax=Sphingobium sp. Sx8-8 TaxID=2933617 RepID=UPI001F5A2058|nr:cytochrome P450 [Sphingobium sp. Sx8-8]
MADYDSGDLEAEVLARNFDHHSPEYAAKSWEINKALRNKCPVAHSEKHGGFWVATTHADVTRIAMDDDTFSSDHDPGGERRGPGFTGILFPEKGPFRQIPIEMDPPESTSYKRLIMHEFTPGAVSKLRPLVTSFVNACLDRVIESGEMDIIRDLASPVPALIAASFLGLPIADWRKYAAPTHMMIYAVVGTPEWQKGYEGIVWINGELQRLIEERRRNPKDDVISRLCNAEIDGVPVPDANLVNMFSLIIQGGFDTTGALIAGAMSWLSDHPEERQKLIEDRSLLRNAGEEFLRYITPTQLLSRTVTREVEVNGEALKPGDHILVSWASANQDESVYECPEQVRFDRKKNNHYAFGVGHHTCMGAAIVRMQWPIVMGAILDRIPDFKVDHERTVPYTSKGVVNGYISMRATFTPGKKVGGLEELEDIIGVSYNGA